MNKLDIIGQENVLYYLSERMKTGQLPNTMLFIGPSGVGKTTMAKKVSIDLMKDITEEDIACVLLGQDTEIIKFFNMSMLKSDEEVKRVISNFTPPMYGRKVLILDECHGMTTQQQDALLIQLENLNSNIYVIMCTTDAYRLNESLVGRMDITLRFSSLSRAELKQLCTKLCDEYELNFEMNKQDAISMISLYSNGDARILQKTMLELSNLKTVITQKHLDAILGDVGIIQPIILLKMLRTNLAQALVYTDKLVLDIQFRNKCARLLCLLNGTSEILSINEQKLIKDLDMNYKQMYFDFLCEILEDVKIDSPKLIALVYKYNSKILDGSYGTVNESLALNKNVVSDNNFEKAVEIINNPIVNIKNPSIEKLTNDLKPRGFNFDSMERVDEN